MDKRICYIKPGGCICDLAVVSKDFVPCDGCTEYALVSPSDLTALETQVAELKAACGLKDGKIELAKEVLSNFLWVNVDDGPNERVPDCDKARAAYVALGGVIPETEDEDDDPNALLPSIDHMAGIAPGLKTITEVAEEYERIGRAVEEWVKRKDSEQPRLPNEYDMAYYNAVDAIDAVIAQAKEGEKA